MLVDSRLVGDGVVFTTTGAGFGSQRTALLQALSSRQAITHAIECNLRSVILFRTPVKTTVSVSTELVWNVEKDAGFNLLQKLIHVP